jgi:hypothetical protein
MLIAFTFRDEFRCNIGQIAGSNIYKLMGLDLMNWLAAASGQNH